MKTTTGSEPPRLIYAVHNSIEALRCVWRGSSTPYTLHLTGPADGKWSSSSGGPELEPDAVDFCRTLSGVNGNRKLTRTRLAAR
jgi:hypothetical protein